MNEIGWFCDECGCLIYYESELKYYKTVFIKNSLRRERQNQHNHKSGDRHCADCHGLMLPFNVAGTFDGDFDAVSQFFSATRKQRLKIWKRLIRKALREQALASGTKQLTEDEVLEELENRRAGKPEPEKEPLFGSYD